MNSVSLFVSCAVIAFNFLGLTDGYPGQQALPTKFIFPIGPPHSNVFPPCPCGSGNQQQNWWESQYPWAGPYQNPTSYNDLNLNFDNRDTKRTDRQVPGYPWPGPYRNLPSYNDPNQNFGNGVITRSILNRDAKLTDKSIQGSSPQKKN